MFRPPLSRAHASFRHNHFYNVNVTTRIRNHHRRHFVNSWTNYFCAGIASKKKTLSSVYQTPNNIHQQIHLLNLLLEIFPLITCFIASPYTKRRESERERAARLRLTNSDTRWIWKHDGETKLSQVKWVKQFNEIRCGWQSSPALSQQQWWSTRSLSGQATDHWTEL